MCERLLQPRPRLRRALDIDDLISDLRVPVVCSLDYRGPVRQMLNAYKDDGQRSLTPWLAPALLASINHALITCVSTHQAPTPVPVPTRKSSQRRRGFDHVERLSAAVTRSGSQCHTRRVLRDTRSDPGSKYLTEEDRSAHVREAFSVRGTLPSLGTRHTHRRHRHDRSNRSRGHGNPRARRDERRRCRHDRRYALKPVQFV